MEFNKVLENRFSVRDYKDIPVEDEKMLDAVFNEFCRIFEEEEMAEEAESLEK